MGVLGAHPVVLLSNYEFSRHSSCVKEWDWDFLIIALLQVLADRALWCLNSFKPQEMSNLVWGVAGITADAAHGHSDGQIDFRDPESGVLVELLNSLCEQVPLVCCPDCILRVWHHRACEGGWPQTRVGSHL
jgi:hypothetical protein